MSDLFVDSFRYTGSTGPWNVLKTFVNIPGFRLMCLKRICNRYSSRNVVGLFSRIWFRRIQRRYGFQIPHKVKIGKGLFLGHYGGIVVNQSVVVGDNCNIAQGVTIGKISRGEKQGSPVIGNRVWIGANSVIVGKIKIGDDVLIAPLTFINFDVPDRATVIGSPGKVIENKGSQGYIKNPV